MVNLKKTSYKLTKEMSKHLYVSRDINSIEDITNLLKNTELSITEKLLKAHNLLEPLPAPTVWAPIFVPKITWVYKDYSSPKDIVLGKFKHKGMVCYIVFEGVTQLDAQDAAMFPDYLRFRDPLCARKYGELYGKEIFRISHTSIKCE
jgi:hypothetical protein